MNCMGIMGECELRSLKSLPVNSRLLLLHRFLLRFQFQTKLGRQKKTQKRQKCAQKKRIRKRGEGDDIFHLASPRHPPPQPSIIQHTSRSNSQYHPLLLYIEPPTSVSTLCLSPLSCSPSPSPSPLPRYDLGDGATKLRNVKNPSMYYLFPLSHSKIQISRHAHIF